MILAFSKSFEATHRTFLKVAFDDNVALFLIDNKCRFHLCPLYNGIEEVRTTVKEVIENEYLRRKGTGEEVPEYVYRAILG
jgi:hypothetical protein